MQRMLNYLKAYNRTKAKADQRYEAYLDAVLATLEDRDIKMEDGNTYFVYDIFDDGNTAHETVRIRRKCLAYHTRRSKVIHVLHF